MFLLNKNFKSLNFRIKLTFSTFSFVSKRTLLPNLVIKAASGKQKKREYSHPKHPYKLFANSFIAFCRMSYLKELMRDYLKFFILKVFTCDRNSKLRLLF
jgi:hypothetical protein